MFANREIWQPGEDVERAQLAHIARNARLDVVGAIAWPGLLTAVLASDTGIIGDADTRPLIAWFVAMTLWAMAAYSVSTRSLGDNRPCLAAERQTFALLYFANSILWSIGMLIIMWAPQGEVATSPQDASLVPVLFAMLVNLGLGATLAVQNSAHLRVFLCAIVPVAVIPPTYLLVASEGVYAGLALLLLALAVWLIAVGTRANAEFTMRLSLENNLETARDHAQDMQTRAEEASKAKSAFMAAMSHELRTPLNAIIGFSELLAMKIFPRGDDRYTQYARDIHASGKHLLALIEDILHIQKIESGAKLYSMQSADLAAELMATRAVLTERARHKSIDLTFDIPDKAPAIIDSRAMRQAVINLAANAIEHTPEHGSVEVKLTARARTWLLEVRDTGGGIPDEIAPHIFEAFFTSSETPYAAHENGTGLGLHITREIVRAHKGRIWFVTSNEGTRFSILIPRPEEARAAA